MVAVAKLLIHVPVKTTERYIYLSWHSVSETADRVSGLIHAVLTGCQLKVKCSTWVGGTLGQKQSTWPTVRPAHEL